ncbi:hypothetical protein BY996DRAFT_437728 [Phakopsora pachyrhizi]|nr:hypothetical protein BY996DRAFT_437728 [Phakopsora pachyrhizi]
MRDLAAESVSNRKPGFIPRISPTIQPPAMALSAGPTGTYMGLSNSFKVPDCMPTPSSGPIPFYCATEGASDDHQLHQKPQVNPNLNKALSDLHINAPQGNVWVNDPLVMSDGSAPVLLASTGSESSAAITLDGSSLETLQPSKTTSIASSEQSSNLVFHSEADGIGSVADAPNKSASENNSKIIPAPEKGTLESQTGATRLLVFHDSANRSGKAGLNANNHGTTNSAASSSQHHGDAGASRLPRKPREAPSAGRGGHNLSASSGLESTSCSGGNQHDAPNTNYSRETSHRKSFNAGQSGKGHHSNRLGNGGGGRSQGGSRSNNWRATSNVAVNNIGNKGRNSERTPQSGRGGSQKTPEEQHFSWAGLPHYPHHGPTYHKYGVAAEHNSPTSNSNHFVQRYAGPPDSPDTRSRTISTGSIATNPVNHGVHMNSPIATVPHGHQATRYYGPPLNHFSATHYPQPSPADPSYSDQGFYPMQQYYYPSPMPQIINEIPLEENQSSGVPPPLAYPSFDPLERPAPLSVYPYALDPLRYYVLGQCEYYFSVDNLVKDQFLRSQVSLLNGWLLESNV